MALEIYACETQTGKVLAQLPGRPAGPIGRTTNTSESLALEIDSAHPALPSVWRELLARHSRSIAVVSEVDGKRTPVYFGSVNDLGVINGKLVAQTASLEWFLDARRPSDSTWPATTPLMKIVRDLHYNFEANGVGCGFAIDAPDTTTRRAWSVRRSSGKTFADVLEDLALEWTVALSWADSTQTRITKTLRVRQGPTGSAPRRQLNIPTDAVTWEWNDSRRESDSATVVFVEGDGSGDLRTTSLPHVDFSAEKAGCPRVEAWESATGVTSVKEANGLAAQHSERRFAPHQTLEVTVRNDGTVGLAGLHLGDGIRVVVDHPALELDEVYRLAAWELSEDGATWTPGFVGANEPLTGWRKPGLDSAAKKARKDEKSSAKRATNPFINGWDGLPDSTGKKWVWDKDRGPGWKGPDGVFKPITTEGGPDGPSTDLPPAWDWGTEGGDENGSPLVASSLRFVEGKVIEGDDSGVWPSTQSGRFIYGAQVLDDGSAELQTSGPIVTPTVTGRLAIFAGELRDGQAHAWGEKVETSISPAVLEQAIRMSTAWTEHGAEAQNVLAHASWEGTGVYAAGDRLYLPMRLAVVIDSDYNRTSTDTILLSVGFSGMSAFGVSWEIGHEAILRQTEPANVDIQAVGQRLVVIQYQGNNDQADPVEVVDLSSRGGVLERRQLPRLPRRDGTFTLNGNINVARVGEDFRLYRGVSWLPVSSKLEAPVEASWTIPLAAAETGFGYFRPVHTRLVQASSTSHAVELTDEGEVVEVLGTQPAGLNSSSAFSYAGWLYGFRGTDPGWALKFIPNTTP